MSNQKFYEAVLRDSLPITREYADKGWPPLLYPWFLALMQLPDADKPAQKAFTLHMGDSIRAGALPAVRQCIPWFIEDEVIEPHVNAQDFAAWLAREGMEPSPLVSEWFAHQGVAPAVARLPPKLPLPQKMSAITAAEILGGGYLLAYVMHLVAVGDMASWSHSPAKGELRHHTDHLHGTETVLPRIDPDTDPASVFVAGDDVLWHWCVLQEEAIHAPALPPKEAVERRLEGIYALQRVPAPAQPLAAAPAPVVADSASSAPAWTVRKPKRYNGYAAPLHRLLTAAHREGNPRPTARDVLEAWRSERPAEIAKVLPDGFDYYNAKGDEKSADLEAIRKAIGRMTSAR